VAEANLPDEQILAIYGRDIETPEQCVQRLHEPTRRALKLIRGHISYGIHNHLPWARCMYFTMVRNPTERVLSLWIYAWRSRPHHLYETLHALGSVEAALEKGVSTEFNNGMCRQLSGMDGPFPQEPYAKTIWPYEDTVELYNKVIELVDRRHISLGTTEYFDAFLYVLCETMGWANREHGKANAGPPSDKYVFSEGDLQAIKYYNMDDIALWEYAKSFCE
jgi:hypothetical protein